ncbi:MAG: LysR family transcriptional regulator [Bdellovibrionales bacterium]|nr:LysR family transcriptional regulator [Bdellovibrionales bacterium]NQZ18639.1 LysR family transcriptional regulator [Bdellovibrionales bacterium]
MEWLNFRHLFAFWSVCRYGGFQKAAEKIHVSQSAISDQVSQLEEYFDEKLLERTTRSLRVTPVGSDLLKYADEIFNKSSEINHIFKDKKDDLQSFQIRIGMVGGISRNFIFRMILQNMVEDDRTLVDVIDGSFEQLNQMLKSLEIDLIFSLERPQKKDLMNLAFKKVKTSSLCIAGRPELIKKLKSRKANKEMSFFMFNHHFEGDIFKQVIEPRFNVVPHVPVSTDDISLLRFMANSGRGLAIVPEIGVQEDLDQGVLSRIRLDEVPLIDFYGIFLKNSFHEKLIENFLS